MLQFALKLSSLDLTICPCTMEVIFAHSNRSVTMSPTNMWACKNFHILAHGSNCTDGFLLRSNRLVNYILRLRSIISVQKFQRNLDIEFLVHQLIRIKSFNDNCNFREMHCRPCMRLQPKPQRKELSLRRAINLYRSIGNFSVEIERDTVANPLTKRTGACTLTTNNADIIRQKIWR